MAAVPFQDKFTLSDLAGQDPTPHQNDPEKVVAAVRGFLSAKATSAMRTRGASAIWKRDQTFNASLPRLARKLEMTQAEIGSFEYLRDWIAITTAWLRLRAV